VLASQGWGVFIFGLIPSLRMSMSVCSLWAVLSFSMVGAAFPVFAMDSPLQSLSWLFPLRHYYIIYQLCVFNTYPLSYVIWHIVALIGFSLLPLLVAHRIFKAFREFGYIP
jgi:ABC-2 type transport system permease protein